jgi:hypothetical protein
MQVTPDRSRPGSQEPPNHDPGVELDRRAKPQTRFSYLWFRERRSCRMMKVVPRQPTLFRPTFDTLKHQDDLQRHGNVDRDPRRARPQLNRNLALSAWDRFPASVPPTDATFRRRNYLANPTISLVGWPGSISRVGRFWTLDYRRLHALILGLRLYLHGTSAKGAGHHFSPARTATVVGVNHCNIGLFLLAAYRILAASECLSRLSGARSAASQCSPR